MRKPQKMMIVCGLEDLENDAEATLQIDCNLVVATKPHEPPLQISLDLACRSRNPSYAFHADGGEFQGGPQLVTLTDYRATR